MTDKELSGKDKFRQALEKQNEFCMAHNLPDEAKLEHSSRYQRKMKRWRSPMRKVYHPFPKLVGMIAVIMIVLSCSVTVYAEREPIKGFVENIYYDCIEVFFDKPSTTPPETTIVEILKDNPNYISFPCPEHGEVKAYVTSYGTWDANWSTNETFITDTYHTIYCSECNRMIGWLFCWCIKTDDCTKKQCFSCSGIYPTEYSEHRYDPSKIAAVDDKGHICECINDPNCTVSKYEKHDDQTGDGLCDMCQYDMRS